MVPGRKEAGREERLTRDFWGRRARAMVCVWKGLRVIGVEEVLTVYGTCAWCKEVVVVVVDA